MMSGNSFLIAYRHFNLTKLNAFTNRSSNSQLFVFRANAKIALFENCKAADAHPSTANMTSEKDKNEGPELLPCSFKFHDFVAEVGEVRMSCQIMKMEESLYLWIGDFNSCTMNDLSFALISNYEKLPISTQLMGSVTDVTSVNIAKRLAKKIGKPVYVSFNLQVDNLSLPGIEKRIQKELKDNPEILGF